MPVPPYAHPLALERLADARCVQPLSVLAAAVAIATHAEPTLQPRVIYQQIDHMARDVKNLLDHSNPMIASVRHVIYDRYGLAGDNESYGDPRLSLINHVLERRCGLPIMVSLLFIELVRRCGGEAYGIGLPGHFVAAVDVGGDSANRVYVDCFSRGKEITAEDCRRIVVSHGVPWHDHYLVPIAEVPWVIRILMNLRNSYAQAGDLAQQSAMLEMILLLGDDSRQEELQRLYGMLALKAAQRN